MFVLFFPFGPFLFLVEEKKGESSLSCLLIRAKTNALVFVSFVSWFGGCFWNFWGIVLVVISYVPCLLHVNINL